MNDYAELRIDAEPCSEEITDLLAAFLADAGYESFVPDEHGLTAYVINDNYNAETVAEILADFPITADFSTSCAIVEGKDWNEEWEKHYFKPIVIAGKCAIHSSFHTDVPEAEYDIVIDPKMAFGTGHHSTTNLMVSYLLDLELKGKSVIDMGTGTAILAILASMRGAVPVFGIEIDHGAWENAIDNVRLNDAKADIIEGDATALKHLEKADIFIANINRNIITGDMEDYASRLRIGGTMLLSGFYEEDIPIVADSAAKYGLVLEEIRTDKNWAAIRLLKAH